MHLIPHNNLNIISYKTVSIATGVLARKSLITSCFLCQPYVALFQCIRNDSDICCHGYHGKNVILLQFSEFV